MTSQPASSGATIATDGRLIIGIRARDVAASAAFYTAALGLEPCAADVGGSPGVRRLTDRGPLIVELIPAPDAPSRPIAVETIDRPGLVNLTFYVPGLDAVCERVLTAGGQVLAETRTSLGPEREAVFAGDPDGTAIELISTPSGHGFTHVVACVDDLSAASALYEALGYRMTRRLELMEPSAPVETLTRLKGVRLRGLILRYLEGGEIELIDVIHPPVDHRSARSAPSVGLACLAFQVANPAEALRAALALEGRETPSLGGEARSAVDWRGVVIELAPSTPSAERSGAPATDD